MEQDLERLCIGSHHDELRDPTIQGLGCCTSRRKPWFGRRGKLALRVGTNKPIIFEGGSQMRIDSLKLRGPIRTQNGVRSEAPSAPGFCRCMRTRETSNFPLPLKNKFWVQ
jgi:hypothetical protein